MQPLRPVRLCRRPGIRYANRQAIRLQKCPAPFRLSSTQPTAAAEIDRLDDAIHDLLMARAEAVAQAEAPALRPGREADILRRLLARHRGALPRGTVVRVWRELLSASLGVGGRFAVAACEAEPGSGYMRCAREHFGTLAPLRAHRTPGQAVAEVRSGAATVAVLPLPVEEEAAPWWTLLHRADPRLYVVARLPVWAPLAEGMPRVEALVVAATAPDASAADRSLIALELPLDRSRAHLSATLLAAGFASAQVLLWRDPSVPEARALADVDGFATDDDPRLGALNALRPPLLLGAYAQPVEGDDR